MNLTRAMWEQYESDKVTLEEFMQVSYDGSTHQELSYRHHKQKMLLDVWVKIEEKDRTITVMRGVSQQGESRKRRRLENRLVKDLYLYASERNRLRAELDDMTFHCTVDEQAEKETLASLPLTVYVYSMLGSFGIHVLVFQADPRGAFLYPIAVAATLASRSKWAKKWVKRVWFKN